MTGQEFCQEFVTIAKEYVGIDRQDNQDQISKFLELFGLPFSAGGVNTPFCAAGASYAALKAYCNLAGIAYTPDNSIEVFKSVIPQFAPAFFTPSASCGVIKQHAIANGRYVTNTQSDNLDIQPGWLVEYNWSGGDNPQHIEIVVDAEDVLNTVGFNTSGSVGGNQIDGGVVALKQRSYDQVVGFIKLC
jgi:hypothetical protein